MEPEQDNRDPDQIRDQMLDDKAEAEYEAEKVKDNKTLKEVNFNAPSDVEYIKLTKNRNGYNWDIKLLTSNVAEVVKLNNELLAEFGSIDI